MSRLEELIEELCPDGVEFLELQELFDTKNGYTPSKGNKDFWDNGNIPWFRMEDIRANGHILSESLQHITPNAVKGALCPAFSIIVATSATIGEHALITVQSLSNQRFTYLIPKEKYSGRVDMYFYNYYCFLLDQWCLNNTNISSFASVDMNKFYKYKFPVPPLPVQREIVRILDNFTELTEELTEELTARKRQYEYYRDELLTNKDVDFEIRTIGEISNYRRGSFPQPYGKKEWYDGEGAMPFVQVADIGEDMRLVNDTKRKISVVAQAKSVLAPEGSIVISLQGSIGRIAITQYDAFIDRTVAIFQGLSDKLVFKYFVYQLQRIFAIKEKTARGSTIKTITKEEFTDFPITIPPIAEQQRIVAILDRFDSLCNDITSGLPAEIAARQKQYEYYRDKLLTFKAIS